MVGGLVQDEEIGLRQHQLRQGDPAPLAAAQIPDALEHVVPGEEEGRQHAADLGVVHVGVGVLELVKESLLHVEDLVLLVVVADVDPGSQADLPGVRLHQVV